MTQIRKNIPDFPKVELSGWRSLTRIASSRRYSRIPARMHILAHICATKQSRTKSFSTNIGTITKNMPTNFELKRLKPKLDIAKKPENRVHELTDSNVSRRPRVGPASYS